MFYTYILRSIEHPEQRYIGHTADLRERLKKHNKGDVPHTAKFRPWKVETYIAFESEEKSIAFAHYLKSCNNTLLLARLSENYGILRNFSSHVFSIPKPHTGHTGGGNFPLISIRRLFSSKKHIDL